jgi:hypothetical protein
LFSLSKASSGWYTGWTNNLSVNYLPRFYYGEVTKWESSISEFVWAFTIEQNDEERYAL